MLVERPDPDYARFSQWVLQEAGFWVDPDAGRGLMRWSLDRVDLRDWRARADRLPGSLSALVLDGPGANPGRIRELRTLLELMGRA